MADSTVRVADAAGQHRYEAFVDGAFAGFAAYERGPGEIVFTHTVVEEEYEGRGVASSLASAALGEARDEGLLVVPRCPFFASYIGRHPEYADLVARRAGRP